MKTKLLIVIKQAWLDIPKQRMSLLFRRKISGYMHIYTHLYSHAHTHIHTHTHTHTYIYIYIYKVCLWVCVCVCVCACLKSIITEAVFTKTEMNNEWTVHFLPNTSCAENVSRLKLYLPRQKWIMNESFIFFQIRAVLKKYRDWGCIYHDGNEQWMKRSFSSN